MSKLLPDDKFLDFSDYGRPIAKWIALNLKNTNFTSIHLTFAFGFSGILAAFCIWCGYFIWAGFFLILKSILDAADGELSRIKNSPSYTGRYLDSIFDILLNLIFLITIGTLTKSPFGLTLLSFFCVQWQGTLYNYYYVILRNISQGGDQTSKVFEQKSPKAFPNESQKVVNILFLIFSFLYGFFDRSIQLMDRQAHRSKNYPSWFMSLVSLYGLGTQLLIMSILLSLGKIDLIIPFFVGFTILLPLIILLRRNLK